MGQGFSHMLHMMTNEFVKNVERNIKDDQNNNESYLNTLNHNDSKKPYINNYSSNEKSLFGLSINNKQQPFNDSQIQYRKSGKLRLPIMTKFIKGKKTKISNTTEVPVSDEEGNNNNDLFDKLKTLNSPQITKIMKKKAQNPLFNSEIKSNNYTENNAIQNDNDKQELDNNTNFKN